MKNEKKSIISWCLFDFGQTAFSTVIVTFVFSAYFAKMVMPGEKEGMAAWSLAIGISGLIIALCSPFLGAIADTLKSRKPWIIICTFFSSLAVALLFFIKPHPSYAYLAASLFIISNTFVEMNQVFYNAYLPSIASRDHIGKISGYGWGGGYLGGLIALVVTLFCFVLPSGISHFDALNIRSSFLFTSIWMLIFALPLILTIRGRLSSQTCHIKEGIMAVCKTFKEAKKHRLIFGFLVARLIYNDGVNAILTLGGVFAAVVFKMSFEELLYFGIAMNISAGFGSFLFSRLDDRLGSKRVILLSLSAMILFGSVILITYIKWVFWVFCLLMSLFIGPVQSSSRSLMARIAPKERITEMFGLYALSGKATSFIGPLMVGLVTEYTSERVGMASLFLLLVIGLALLKSLNLERKKKGA